MRETQVQKTYELWHSSTSNSHTFFESGHPDRSVVLEPDAVLIWTVTADSYDEAQAKKNEYLGWAPYKPIAD